VVHLDAYLTQLGLDDGAQVAITNYLRPIERFIQAHVSSFLPKSHQFPPAEHKTLLEPFKSFEKQFSKEKLQEVFVALADQMGLRAQREAALLRTAYRRGRFDSIDPLTHKRHRLPEIAVLPRVREILYTYPFKTGKRGKIDVLLDEGWCPDRDSAERMVADFERLDREVAALARGVVVQFIEHGVFAPLKVLGYPLAEELLLIQKRAGEIAELCTAPEQVLAELRRYVLALYHVLSSIDSPHRLWYQDMLHLPRHSGERQQYQHAYSSPLQRDIIEQLQVRLECSTDVAQNAFLHWFHDGLDGLIEWRSAVYATTSLSSLAEHRIQRIVQTHLHIFDAEATQRATILLLHLIGAMEDARYALPLRRLLTRSRLSTDGKQFGRRIWFGHPSIQQRKQRVLRKYRGVMRPHRIIRPLDDQHEMVVVPRPEDRFVAAFQRRSGLNTDDARTFIREIAARGALGALHDWRRAAPQPILSYIQLVKDGHLAGTVRDANLHRQVVTLATSLGLPTPPLQIVSKMYTGLPKTHRTNSGDGPVVDHVKKRKTKTVEGRRLHKEWLVVPITISLGLIDPAGQLLSERCFVLLVLEQATERFVGCWASPHEPGLREVGLALWVSIWHPWFPHWPIRGIPEIVRVPSSLRNVNRSLRDLQQAAAWLLMDIDVTQETVWSGPRYKDDPDVVDRLRVFGPGHVRQLFETQRVTCAQAQEGLLHYLLHDKEAFPHHTPAPIRQEYLDVGLWTAGYDSPAAGWLLPLQGITRVQAGGVVIDGVRYTNPWITLPEGKRVLWRSFEHAYPEREIGIFAQLGDNTLYYMRPGSNV
jgi:hypothetical protein